MSKVKAYLANGLFSEADQAYNRFLAGEIRKEFPDLELYVPQENESLNDKEGYADSREIFKGDNSYLDRAHVLIAVLDGVEIDSGVAAEIGRFAVLREMDKQMIKRTDRIIIGVSTDVRQQGRGNEKKINALIMDGTENQFSYRNLYVIGAIKENGHMVSSSEELIKKLHEVLG